MKQPSVTSRNLPSCFFPHLVQVAIGNEDPLPFPSSLRIRVRHHIFIEIWRGIRGTLTRNFFPKHRMTISLGSCMREITIIGFSPLCLPILSLKFLIFDLLRMNYDMGYFHFISEHEGKTLFNNNFGHTQNKLTNNFLRIDNLCLFIATQLCEIQNGFPYIHTSLHKVEKLNPFSSLVSKGKNLSKNVALNFSQSIGTTSLILSSFHWLHHIWSMRTHQILGTSQPTTRHEILKSDYQTLYLGNCRQKYVFVQINLPNMTTMNKKIRLL